MSAQYGVGSITPLSSFIGRMRNVTPAMLPTGQTDNYAPADVVTQTPFYKAEIIRLAVHPSGGSVSGLESSNIADGQYVIIENHGPGELVLPNESAGSLPENRFTLPSGLDLTVKVGSSVMLIRDAASQRFRVGAGTGVGGGGGSGGGLPVVNVKDNGASGGGVVDDAPAFTAAATLANSQGARLFVPAGTYNFATMPTFTGQNLIIEGARGAVFVVPTNTRNGVAVGIGSRNVTFRGIKFQGDPSDDKFVNRQSAIFLSTDVQGTVVDGCEFDHCSPLVANDQLSTRGLLFVNNYVHNAPGGMHPPTDSVISRNRFICDTSLEERGQAIYTSGQQENITISENIFRNINEEDIQIRATNPRWDQRATFKIINNTFENSNQYSIWVGSDDRPDIGAGVIITGNTFRNCVSPIMARGCKSPVITGNHFQWDFEYPYYPLQSGAGITVLGGISSGNMGQTSRSAVIANNKFIHKHPFLAKVTITAIPQPGDTLTVGDIQYTWRTTASLPYEIQIGGDLRASADNLVNTLRGSDGRTPAHCNAMRYPTDAFNNFFGASYGETNNNEVYIAGWYAFPIAQTGGRVTISIAVPDGLGGFVADDRRQVCPAPIDVRLTLAPLIVGNAVDDFQSGVVLLQNVSPTMTDNVFTDFTGSVPIVGAKGNVFSRYAGNRRVHFNKLIEGRPYASAICDAFPVIEDTHVMLQDFMHPEMQGRSGISPVGDGKAWAWFWYGLEGGDPASIPTRPYRWDDGDTVQLLNGGPWIVFKFKRTSPNPAAKEFNDVESLRLLIEATGIYTAAYAYFQNNTSVADPKILLKITSVAGGAATNLSRAAQIIRGIKPNDQSAFTRTVQPLLNGVMLRNRTPGFDEQSCAFFGGSDTLTRTFVYTPIANATRGVFVQGADAPSHALAPVVYAADIVMGVGFWITHADATSAPGAKFFWRVN